MPQRESTEAKNAGKAVRRLLIKELKKTPLQYRVNAFRSDVEGAINMDWNKRDPSPHLHQSLSLVS